MTDPVPNPAELLALARPIATEVGEHLVRSFAGAGPEISTKSTETDLVTDLDRWAEGHIVERLLAARPHDGVQGEEGADRPGTSGVTWCIDPIDGTVNFVHAMPGFNISIAAQVDGHSVAAVVVSPLHHDVFTATRGGGAARNDQPIACSRTTELGRAVVGTGFGYDPGRRGRQGAVVARVLPQIADIRRGGAAAVDLCWVACGRLDAYWEVGLSPWDHAAGGLVATEAGARCTDLDGGPADGTFTLAAPPQLWDQLGGVLRAEDAAGV